jgi:hypothetical protein
MNPITNADQALSAVRVRLLTDLPVEDRSRQAAGVSTAGLEDGPLQAIDAAGDGRKLEQPGAFLQALRPAIDDAQRARRHSVSS